jgi:DNA polymerase-3 subunit delta
MKVNLPQLEAHLAKNLAPIYVISSDEILLVQDTVSLIRHAAEKKGFTERTLLSADANTEWGKILFATAYSVSLFSSKQIIELNMHNAKFGANTTKALQEYAAKPQTDTLLLVRTNKVDGKTEKSAWFQSLEKNSVFIPIWPIPTAQLPQWIMQRAKKNNLIITKNIAELIATQSEGNLLAIAQEIEKLFLYRMENVSLPTQQEQGLFIDNAHFDVFDLVDSVVTGNAQRSLRILKNLAAEDTEPTLILWALSREFRTLSEIITQLKQGITFAAVCNKFHVFEKRQASVRAFTQRYSAEQCWNRLLKAAQIDRIIKGAEIGNVWDELEQLVI